LVYDKDKILQIVKKNEQSEIEFQSRIERDEGLNLLTHFSKVG